MCNPALVDGFVLDWLRRSRQGSPGFRIDRRSIS